MRASGSSEGGHVAQGEPDGPSSGLDDAGSTRAAKADDPSSVTEVQGGNGKRERELTGSRGLEAERNRERVAARR